MSVSVSAPVPANGVSVTSQLNAHEQMSNNSVPNSNAASPPLQANGTNGGNPKSATASPTKQRSVPPVTQKDTTFTKIFVGGLPYHTTDETLRKFFEQFGDIEEAVVITDRQTGKSRGYGFVTMADKEAALLACMNPNPIIDGRKANVNLAYLGAKPRSNQAAAAFSLAAYRLPALLPAAASLGLSPLLLPNASYIALPNNAPNAHAHAHAHAQTLTISPQNAAFLNATNLNALPQLNAATGAGPMNNSLPSASPLLNNAALLDYANAYIAANRYQQAASLYPNLLNGASGSAEMQNSAPPTSASSNVNANAAPPFDLVNGPNSYLNAYTNLQQLATNNGPLNVQLAAAMYQAHHNHQAAVHDRI